MTDGLRIDRNSSRVSGGRVIGDLETPGEYRGMSSSVTMESVVSTPPASSFSLAKESDGGETREMEATGDLIGVVRRML